LSAALLAAQPIRSALAAPATPTAGGYGHPEWLIGPEELATRLGTPTLRVVALTPRDEFDAAHLDGAVQIDWPELEIVETGDQQIATWRTAIEEILSRLGITPDHEVVVYDGGSFYSARLWWVLHQLGHGSVQILDGGLPAWLETGLTAASGPAVPFEAPAPYLGAPNDDAVATIAEVEAALGRDDTLLIDARTPEEYAAGHIPGAVNIPFTENAVAPAPARWRPAEELRSLYASAGLATEMLAIPYCTTGVRSAATYFTLRLIGHERTSLFTGSFKEWSSHPDLPVTTGDAP
jgi:thiosulfate/3-mercaptopyruvate sulfurtransferase